MSGRAVKFALAAALLLGLSAAGRTEDRPAVRRQPVELELVLAVDTSVSVDVREFALQMLGLADAFRDQSVVAAIRQAGRNGIAVTLVQWSLGLQQRIAVDWSHLHDAASAAAFARAIETSPRHFTGNGTSISSALVFSSKLFDDNGFRGRRRVIDVSGDGRNNSGSSPAGMRDLIVAQGVVINGLAILDGDLALGRYFQANVAGGANSFVITANTFGDYAEAIRRKLLREISVPVALAPGETGGPGLQAFPVTILLPSHPYR